MKEVMFSIKINTNAGPDGYSSNFYRDAWDIVGEEVTNAVKEFLKMENCWERLMQQQ